jgi:hypothetical protein
LLRMGGVRSVTGVMVLNQLRTELKVCLAFSSQLRTEQNCRAILDLSHKLDQLATELKVCPASY